MKNYVVIAIIAIAGFSQSAEYAITKNITTTKNQEVTVVATTFVIERFSAIVDREAPMFLIQGSYKDASGTVLERKSIRVSMEQAIQMMPTIDQIMMEAQAVVEANIQNLLAE